MVSASDRAIRSALQSAGTRTHETPQKTAPARGLSPEPSSGIVPGAARYGFENATARLRFQRRLRFNFVLSDWNKCPNSRVVAAARGYYGGSKGDRKRVIRASSDNPF